MHASQKFQNNIEMVLDPDILLSDNNSRVDDHSVWENNSIHAMSSPSGRRCDRDLLNTRFNYWCFFTLGLVNNFSYVVISASSADLASTFQQNSNIGIILWASIGAGFAVKALNTFYFVKRHFHFNPRVHMTLITFFIGYLGLSLSLRLSFSSCIVFIFLTGGACSFGESVILGYLKSFPSSMTGAWSSGTGLAGVGGVSFYLLLKSIFREFMEPKVYLSIIYFMLIATLFIYAYCFFWGISRPPGMKRGFGCSDSGNSNMEISEMSSENQPEDEDTSTLLPSIDADRSDETLHITEDSILLVHRRLFFPYSLPLCLVYFAEYVISVGCAQVANASRYKEYDSSEIPWGLSNAFVLLSFAYQGGVLISRSSLHLFRTKRTWLICLLQGFNLILWLLQAYFQVISYSMFWIQILLMFWVGLMGGLMYVNVFSNIVDDATIKDSDRELAMNLVCFYVNFGMYVFIMNFKCVFFFHMKFCT